MTTKLSRFLAASMSLTLLATACTKDKKKFGLSSIHKEDELIVTLKEGVQRSAGVTQLRAYGTSAEPLNGRSYLIKFPVGADLEKMAEALSSRDDVLAVEANQIYKLYEKTPNDADFGELWGMKNTGQAGVDIGATAAWDETTGSRDVVVGVIDSGIDYTHPDLADNIWKNPGETGLDAQGRDKSTNGIDDDGNGLVDDFRGYDFYNNDNDPLDGYSHGTHVAGTLGALGDNGEGVAGVNWNITLVPIKVFSDAGATSTDVLVKGIEYATSLGVFATNNSWGGGEYSEAILGAIQRAEKKRILFVAAAGNDSEDNDTGLHFPSNYPVDNIISVAAIDRFDALSVFSNWGSKTVDVAAPGEDIYSTLPKARYGLKSGTSMAAPHVTGALALLKARFPELSAAEIKQKLLASTVQTPQLIGKVIYGRINVANAMERDETPPAPVDGLKIVEAGVNSLRLSWNPTGDDGDVGAASQYQIRLSALPIATEDDWLGAESPTVETLTRGGDLYTATIKDLAFNRKGYVTVRALDNVGNLSELSQSLAFTLKQTETLWSEGNGANHQWAAFGSPWGIKDADGVTMVSDSPDGFYTNGLDKSVVSKEIDVGTSDLVLELRQRYDLEKDFDFGLIELSLDSGLTWQEVGRVSGKSEWTTQTYPLKSTLGPSKRFKLRLRIKTDNSVNAEGWDIDSLKISGARP
jgi:subtilisin family serine protease